MKSCFYIVLSLVLFTVGCGPNLSPVTGTVTLDDKPVENAIVSFVPVEGGTSASGTTDANGKYTLVCVEGVGVAPGTYRVSIAEVPPVQNSGAEESSEAAASSNSSAYESMASGGGAAQYKAAEKRKDKIPAKYNAQSTLQKDVISGPNEIDFALSSKG